MVQESLTTTQGNPTDRRMERYRDLCSYADEREKELRGMCPDNRLIGERLFVVWEHDGAARTEQVVDRKELTAYRQRLREQFGDDYPFHVQERVIGDDTCPVTEEEL